MAKRISAIYIAFIMLWIVCITTQKKTRQQAKSDGIEKSLKKRSLEHESSSYSKILGTFINLYFLSRHNKTLTSINIIKTKVQPRSYLVKCEH